MIRPRVRGWAGGRHRQPSRTLTLTEQPPKASAFPPTEASLAGRCRPGIMRGRPGRWPGGRRRGMYPGPGLLLLFGSLLVLALLPLILLVASIILRAACAWCGVAAPGVFRAMGIIFVSRLVGLLLFLVIAVLTESARMTTHAPEGGLYVLVIAA